MHGKRMREANHRAAVQIFERVNSSLLPQNILDLHGLHVDEALRHLAQVLHDKTTGNGQHTELSAYSLKKFKDVLLLNTVLGLLVSNQNNEVKLSM